jgi:hypothetical protein
MGEVKELRRVWLHVELALPAHQENPAAPAIFGIEFPHCGTERLEFTLAGAMPSVSVLRTTVSNNETMSRQISLPRQ